MSFRIALGEASAKLHPEAHLYIDDHLRLNGDWIRRELGLQGEILHDPGDTELHDKLATIESRSVEIFTTLQGDYSLAMVGKIVNPLRMRGVEVTLFIEPLPEHIREFAGAPRIVYQPSMDVSTPKPNPLQVFLCHARPDKPKVRDLYRYLRGLELEVWFDEESLLPGQDWKSETEKAIRESDLVLVCLSSRSVDKVGYVQKEIRYALDYADEQPEDAAYIVPVKLEECEVPTRLARWHYVNLWETAGHDRLAQALSARAAQLGGRK